MQSRTQALNNSMSQPCATASCGLALPHGARIMDHCPSVRPALTNKSRSERRTETSNFVQTMSRIARLTISAISAQTSNCQSHEDDWNFDSISTLLLKGA